MFFESIAIFIVMLLVLIIFIREHHNEYAKTAAILMILPVSYILSYIITILFNHLFNFQTADIIFIGIIIGLIITCLLIGLMAHHIQKKSLKTIYVCMNSIFALVLTIIMMINLSLTHIKLPI